MIYVEMGGRYGNQLFHYACARYVQIKTGDKDLVLNYNSVFSQHRESEGWIDVLKDLNVVPYSYYDKEGTVLKKETSLFQKVLVAIKALQIKVFFGENREVKAKAAGWFSTPLNHVGIYWIREGMKSIRPNPRRKKHIVTGTCECPDVFKEIADVLSDELMPRQEPLQSSKYYLDMMNTSDSICMNVRRGDFFNQKNVKSFGVCTIDYYKNAYQRMIEQGFKHPHFFIVSDDIDWCRTNLGFEGGVTYIPDSMPPYETMRLMANCKNFIISNSTFSWWGCYLSKNKNKIVISPSRWNNDGYNSRLIQKEWILIDP